MGSELTAVLERQICWQPLMIFQKMLIPGTVVISKANCGIPEFVDGSIIYSGTEELMSAVRADSYELWRQELLGVAAEPALIMSGPCEKQWIGMSYLKRQHFRKLNKKLALCLRGQNRSFRGMILSQLDREEVDV